MYNKIINTYIHIFMLNFRFWFPAFTLLLLRCLLYRVFRFVCTCWSSFLRSSLISRFRNKNMSTKWKKEDRKPKINRHIERNRAWLPFKQTETMLKIGVKCRKHTHTHTNINIHKSRGAREWASKRFGFISSRWRKVQAVNLNIDRCKAQCRTSYSKQHNAS